METQPMSEFQITAIYDKANGGHYKHFGICSSSAVLYGDKPEDIVEVHMRISADQTIPPLNEQNMNADYWGWFDNSQKEFNMIYAKHFLLNMCFPCGIVASENAGQGKAYRLEIISTK